MSCANTNNGDRAHPSARRNPCQWDETWNAKIPVKHFVLMVGAVYLASMIVDYENLAGGHVETITQVQRRKITAKARNNSITTTMKNTTSSLVPGHRTHKWC